MKEFEDLQKELLRHKKLYYVENKAEITDYEYDMLEEQSYKLARRLGFRADKWEDALENEAHHIHWMIGYKEGSIYEN